jgi:hypothetical protein
MATLTVTNITLSGGTPSFVSADSAGDLFANTGGTTMFHVKNSDSSSHNVTFDCQKPCNYGYDHDVVGAVPAGEERIIGPFTTYRWNNADGKVSATYDAVTGLTVAAYNLVMS